MRRRPHMPLALQGRTRSPSMAIVNIENEMEMIDIDRVFLDLENPRHEPYEQEQEAIDYLCRREDVLALARDIVKNGLSPLELFALIRDGDGFVVAEGNRRLCAIKLLRDADLARQPKLRQRFRNAAKGWDSIAEIPAIVFESRQDVRLWLDRIHAGYSGGRGRRQWDAEQKARNTGYSKNLGCPKGSRCGRALRFHDRGRTTRSYLDGATVRLKPRPSAMPSDS